VISSYEAERLQQVLTDERYLWRILSPGEFQAEFKTVNFPNAPFILIELPGVLSTAMWMTQELIGAHIALHFGVAVAGGIGKMLHGALILCAYNDVHKRWMDSILSTAKDKVCLFYLASKSGTQVNTHTDAMRLNLPAFYEAPRNAALKSPEKCPRCEGR